ncbi:MAG TPA: hypothetical protein VER33_07760 [Polyangiaceae bacterium]|nr:hypothetical protein [Polyangiaceae bacterium]
MNIGKLRMVGFSAGLLTLLATTAAFAQETTDGQAEASAEGQVGLGLPGATPATTTTTTTTTAAAGGSDHDLFVGRLAVGYLGRSSLTVGVGEGAAAVSAPVLGVRYWLDRGLGLDLGVGFGFSGGSVSSDPGDSVDLPSRWAVILHGGVPLALATGRHYVFEIIPEANVGLGGGSSGDDISHRGFLLDVGARAGAEVHFGFIGIPELSLQASVGALLAFQSAGTTTDMGGTEVEVSNSSRSFGTTVNNSPWNIFTSNVSAFYYF